MSAYIRTDTPGFHVIVMSAEPDHETIVINRTTADGVTPAVRPIYWGNGELGTLTPAEKATVDALLPAAVRQDRPQSEPASQPEEATMAAPAFSSSKLCIFLIGTVLGATLGVLAMLP